MNSIAYPDRRTLLSAAAMIPLLALTACAGSLGSFSPEEGVRRLLTLSSQRAFARLLQPGGFYDDQLTRIAPPAQLAGGSSGVLGAVLRTNAVRSRVAIALNDVAVDAADRATPVVTDAIARMSVADALALVRGGPTAATDLLQREAGPAVIDALLPGISQGLTSDVAEILAAVAATRSGVDYIGIARLVADQASASIFRAIGREEAEIRANPRATGDPVLIALLGVR
jgi:hypothetical protein